MSSPCQNDHRDDADDDSHEAKYQADVAMNRAINMVHRMEEVTKVRFDCEQAEAAIWIRANVNVLVLNMTTCAVFLDRQCFVL